ncbi:unnamed protein product [Toxocara canis]|uniref:STAS domain-containing protein n=1 Tax=Toxocara canis TaxID=6265 RepID=A0A183UEJ6_TOXCA|nr:unnamed protein product [Toxocara canis]
MDDGLREGRAVMNQEDFDEKYGYHPPISTTCHRAKKAARKCIDPCTSGRKFLKAVTGCVPILEWLPKYNFKGYLVRDIIGGLTTGIMHVPQGIAYSVLSGVAPVYGLYSSFFPVLFYMIFGTSRHTSIVVALMSGIANEQIMSKYVTTTNSTMNATEDTTLTPIQVASTLTFALGMIQFATGLLRLEFLTDYFSDQLVAGFTTGAACHVFTAQLDDIFGLTVPKVSGPGYIFRVSLITSVVFDISQFTEIDFQRIYDIIIRIPHANVCTVITSAIGIAFLYVGKDFISPFVNKRSPVKIPIPYELILVGSFVLIMFAAISYLLNLNERYGMIIVGDIPAGVPEPQLPNISILSDCLIGAAGIAAVTIAVHISMAKMLAKKMKYKIDARQELYALGLSAMLGGLFPIYPVSTALGRTMVNVESGSKTQLSSLFSCLLLLTIILWLGPLLETLPMWVWFIAFISTVAISVVEGLAISIAVALLTIIFRSQWPKSATLARIPDTNDFKDPRKYTAALPCPNICIFRFDSALLFVNAERFKRSITEAMSVWELDSNVVANNGNPPDKNYLIIDCSCIAFIDYTGATALKEVANDARSRHVELFLAATTANVRQSLEVSGFFSTVSKKYFFPTISDAFHFATANR